MDAGVLGALLPVIAMTAVGFGAGRIGWLGPTRVRWLSRIVFVVLAPALLFRTMSRVNLAGLDFKPVGAYFIAVAVIFGGTLALRGFNRRAAVLALANTYSNNVMIGIPLVALAYGQTGLVALFTLVSVHALVLLTTATIVLELALLREDPGASDRSTPHTVLLAVRNSIIHPVPLPIIAGLLFSAAGLALPPAVDLPLQWLGWVFGPLALLMVGASLAATRFGTAWRAGLELALAKNLLHPIAVALIAGWLAIGRVEFNVMVLSAALPIGANVFLFSQRYGVAQEEITAGVAISTLLAVPSVALVMALLS
ncbi:AEC family transporter [Ramlibacter sp. PS4R-6]|uniref:AEC family transporter n=1 Tax=Ramlibacter sp. PS4R-6 TaxID=3133438 RepID=UPI00309CD784